MYFKFNFQPTSSSSSVGGLMTFWVLILVLPSGLTLVVVTVSSNRTSEPFLMIFLTIFVETLSPFNCPTLTVFRAPLDYWLFKGSCAGCQEIQDSVLAFQGFKQNTSSSFLNYLIYVITDLTNFIFSSAIQSGFRKGMIGLNWYEEAPASIV